MKVQQNVVYKQMLLWIQMYCIVYTIKSYVYIYVYVYYMYIYIRVFICKSMNTLQNDVSNYIHIYIYSDIPQQDQHI